MRADDKKDKSDHVICESLSVFLPVIRALFHIRIGALHPTLWPVQLDETKLLVQTVGIFGRQNPTTKALQPRMRNDHCLEFKLQLAPLDQQPKG